ncbi:unnamed protein product [Sphacelaria rigidula]
MWRNPYDWTAAMSENPHHSKANTFLESITEKQCCISVHWVKPELRVEKKALLFAKIKDFAAVREWAPMYEAIRYEDMLDLDYLNKWFSSLESKYGLVGSPSKLPTAEQSSWMKRRLEVMYYTNSTHCAPNCTMGVQLDALETMNELFDVELETSIGYHKIVPSC